MANRSCCDVVKSTIYVKPTSKSDIHVKSEPKSNVYVKSCCGVDKENKIYYITIDDKATSGILDDKLFKVLMTNKENGIIYGKYLLKLTGMDKNKYYYSISDYFNVGIDAIELDITTREWRFYSKTVASQEDIDIINQRLAILEQKPGLDKTGTVTKVLAGEGLVISGDATTTPQVNIDDSMTFILNCGQANFETKSKK